MTFGTRRGFRFAGRESNSSTQAVGRSSFIHQSQLHEYGEADRLYLNNGSKAVHPVSWTEGASQRWETPEGPAAGLGTERHVVRLDGDGWPTCMCAMITGRPIASGWGMDKVALMLWMLRLSKSLRPAHGSGHG